MFTLLDRALFLCGETTAALRRNGAASAAAVSTAAVALALAGAFVVLAYQSHRFLSQWPSRFEMRVVMADDATPEQLEATDTRIRAIQDVYDLEHQTKEENWAHEQAALKDAVGDLSDLQNPLPDTFTFKMRRLERADIIANAIQRMPGVGGTQYMKREIQAAIRITNVVRIVGLGVSIALLVAAMALIHNAVRLTVLGRRREIRVMQMVGATSHAIRLPFVMEAVVHGALGGAIAAAILWLAARPIIDLVNQVPIFHAELTARHVGVLFGSLASAGGLIGMICGTLVVRRFLRV